MIAITGSNGFVGQSLIAFAERQQILVRPISRADYLNEKAFENCDVVIHLAGLAHRRSASLPDFVKVNCDLAVNCAFAAAKAGVKRFIYVSSSKALCEFAETDLALNESVYAYPACDYGRSKLAAEKELLKLQQDGILNVIIIRPALVIGAPAKANLAKLAKAARWAVQRPSASVLWRWVLSGFHAPKSFTSLENLCSALLFLSYSEHGDGKIFHVVDDLQLSTAALFLRLQAAVDPLRKNLRELDQVKSSLKPPLEPWFIKALLISTGLRHTYKALAYPFVLDGTKIQRELGWKPKALIDVELQRIMANLSFPEDGSKG